MPEHNPTGFPIMHEIYLSFLGAGFTEPQAMQLLCAQITAMAGGAS